VGARERGRQEGAADDAEEGEASMNMRDQAGGARRYALGLPLWGHDAWVGDLYPSGAHVRDYLGYYAEVMDAVEGNTTFYSTPSTQTVARWRAETPERFRFHFKFPRRITHDAGLTNVARETRAFLGALAPLDVRLGAFMLQFPASFGPDSLPRLADYLASLPREHRYAVEVRHPAFFTGTGACRLEALLAEHGIERIVMDTRGMRLGDPEHPAVQAAAHEKPDVPVRMHALTDRPVVRFVAHPVPSVNAALLARWAAVFAGWIGGGRRPTFFMHCPDNTLSPQLARSFDTLLRARVDMPALPAFPGPEAVPQLALL
jgi:uncharacterized protein YecE (DUF72 family)